MPGSILVNTLEVVRRHPWWHARAKLSLAVLRKHGITPPATVMDVGCGWGINLQALEDAGHRATGLDVSRQILEVIDRPQRRLIEADLNRDMPETFSPNDALLVLDVIEHLDDDRGAMRRIADLVRPGGSVVVSVPALPELYSEFDAIQGHRRRYTPETLRAVFEGSEFSVSEMFWWGAWMVPVLRRMRLRPAPVRQSSSRTYEDYLQLPPWPGTLVMRLAFACEEALALRGRLPVGSSLFAVVVRN